MLQDNTDNPIIRKVIIFSVIGIVLIAALIAAVWVYQHGRLAISVNELKIEPAITVVNEAGEVVVDHKGYSINTTLPSGNYVARVVSGINTSEKTIKVGNFLATSNESIDVIDSLFTLPITNTPMYKPQITDTGVRFIDTVVWKLGEYNDPDLNYYDINNAIDAAWIDDRSGYVITQSFIDNKPRLGLVQGSSMKDIPLPIDAMLPVSISYDNGSLFIVLENQLYKYDGNSFDRLFDVEQGTVVEFATDTLMGMTHVPSGSSVDKNVNLKITDYSGDIKYEANLGTAETIDLWSAASVSSDGSMIAIGAQGQVAIHSADNFSEIYRIPSTNVSALEWSGDKIIYATGNALWQYDVGDGLSQSITELLSYISISDIITHDDDIYIISQKPSTSSLLKITKDINLDMDSLDGTETTSLDPGCYFNYFNLSKTTIFVHQEGNDISRCIEPITNLVRSIGVNPDNIPIRKSNGSYNPY